jgi:RecJ-like exonuclease
MTRKEIDGILAQARVMDAQRAAFEYAKAMIACPACEGGVIEEYPEGEPTLVACPTCEGRGEVSEHYECPCLSGRPDLCPQHQEEARDSAGDRKASREEQHGRYLDCGPQAWDDR